MIIIPEIKTVVVLVPRTGSGTLKRAIAARYPKAMMLYRHMEADGVPHSYDRWRRVGVLREPVARLWSLYKFCGQDVYGSTWPEYVERRKRAVGRPFAEWVVENEVPFTNAYSDGEDFYPDFAVLHSMPENRKSQFVHLRPDLGTEIWPFEALPALMRSLDLQPMHANRTEPSEPPELDVRANMHVEKFFSWDRMAHRDLRLAHGIAVAA